MDKIRNDPQAVSQMNDDYYAAANSNRLTAKVAFRSAALMEQRRLLTAALRAYDHLLNVFSPVQDAFVQEQVAKAWLNKAVLLGKIGSREQELAAYNRLISTFATASLPSIRLQVASAHINRGILLESTNPAAAFLAYRLGLKDIDECRGLMPHANLENLVKQYARIRTMPLPDLPDVNHQPAEIKENTMDMENTEITGNENTEETATAPEAPAETTNVEEASTLEPAAEEGTPLPAETSEESPSVDVAPVEEEAPPVETLVEIAAPPEPEPAVEAQPEMENVESVPETVEALPETENVESVPETVEAAPAEETSAAPAASELDELSSLVLSALNHKRDILLGEARDEEVISTNRAIIHHFRAYLAKEDMAKIFLSEGEMLQRMGRPREALSAYNEVIALYN